MKIKNSDFINLTRGFSVLVDTKFPLFVSRKVREIAKTLNSKAESVNVNIDEINAIEDIEEKEKELEIFLNEEIEVNVEKLKIEDLGDLEISAAELGLIESILE